MIVRDEAENLREWLPNATKYVNEIVAVDTGSQDDTVSVLESAGAKVLHQPWEEDFAKHRNFGLSHVESDWVLVLDADERLKQVHWYTLRLLLKNEDVIAYSFSVKNYHSPDDLTSYDIMKSYRLFRNNHNITYTGVVHNQLAPAIQKACRHAGMITQHAFITVEHHGYALSEQDKMIKHARIYKMVKKQLEETPDDDYYLFHLLTICLAMGKFTEAREAVSRMSIAQLRPELRVKAYYKAAQVEMHFNMYKAARAYIRYALSIAPGAAFLHYLLSNILYQMHRYSAGLRSAYRALDFAREKSDTTTLVYLPLDECHANIGIGYLLSRDFKQARQYFDESLQINPHNPSATKYLAWIQEHVTDAAARPYTPSSETERSET